MEDRLISLKAAIDALGEEPEVWTENDEYALGLNNQWHYDVNALKAVPSAQPEQLWIPCGKCIHADGKHRWCKILDRSINEDYFCCWAESWEEGNE